jgi:Raf kinase inhibitor-like YbhB/YbcL family protein
MRILSSAYPDGGRMPAVHATTRVDGGANVSPPLAWEDVPAGTRSFALAMVDLHPVAHGWVHWLVADIPGSARSLAEGASGAASMPAGSRELVGTWGATGYGGPQPPAGTGDHAYETRLMALDVERLDVGDHAELPDVERATAGHVLGVARVTGVFGR